MQNMVKRLTLGLAVAIIGTGISYAIPTLAIDQTIGLGTLGVELFLATLIGSFIGAPAKQETSATKQQTSKLTSKTTSPSDNNDAERKTVFVGNLAFKASPRQLRELFEAHGTVYTVRIATDRNTRKPRGFGFVEMSTSGADLAIQALHGHLFCNRPLTLSEAKQRETQS